MMSYMYIRCNVIVGDGYHDIYYYIITSRIFVWKIYNFTMESEENRTLFVKYCLP